MSNSAIITTRKDYENDGIAMYLHWNGGRDSIEPFLKYCEIKNYTSPERSDYGWARLCQVISNFIGGNTTVGIDKFSQYKNMSTDNGLYIIENWKIIDRKKAPYFEQDEYDLHDMLKAINEAQPTKEQLPIPILYEQNLVEPRDLKLFDKVMLPSGYLRDYGVYTVIDFGKNIVVNGCKVKGLPRIDRFGDGMYHNPEYNINNYIRNPVYLVRKNEI